MKRLFLLFVLLTGVAGCAAPAAPASQPTSLPPSTVIVVSATTAPTNVPPAAPTLPASQPTAATNTDAGETITYRDEDAGFELKFPRAWNMTPITDPAIKKSPIYAVTIYSFPPEQGGQGVPAGGTKMDIVVMQNGATTLSEALDLRNQEFASSGLNQQALTQDMINLGGKLAARRRVSGQFGESLEFLTVLNGKTILLTGIGDEAVLDAIAKTLKSI